MKKALAFAMIATVTAAVALAISGPSHSVPKPVSASQTSTTADIVSSVSGTTLSNAPTKYLPPSYGQGFGSSCAGGGCCPK